MSVHPPLSALSGHEPFNGRQPRVGHADVLDAWLGSELQPVDDSAPRVGSRAVDWNAPSWPAALTYDTADQRLPAGVRIAAREENRRLMFEAHAYEVMLRVASDSRTQQHDVAGQVLFQGLPLPGATVRLDRSEPSPTISTDQTGQFRLPPLVHGAYGLKIAVEGAILTVPPIALR